MNHRYAVERPLRSDLVNQGPNRRAEGHHVHEEGQRLIGHPTLNLRHRQDEGTVEKEVTELDHKTVKGMR